MPAPGGSLFKLKEKEDELHVYIETYKTYSNGTYTAEKNNPESTVHISLPLWLYDIKFFLYHILD
jgi:hypothetical protein